MGDVPEPLRRHVDAFNEGVRTGDFTAMVDGFTDDAELIFDGAPVGPFLGRPAIAEAYRSRPPDDEIDLLGVTQTATAIEAVYGWRADGGRPAGRMIVTPSGRSIARLVVTFDPA